MELVIEHLNDVLPYIKPDTEDIWHSPAEDSEAWQFRRRRPADDRDG